MPETCRHPPERLFVGFYAPGAHGFLPSDDTMWVACCACGEVIREAPAFQRDQAEWEAQQHADEQP